MFPHHGIKKFFPAFGNSFLSISTDSFASCSRSDVTIMRFGDCSIIFLTTAEPTSPHPPRTRTVVFLISIGKFSQCEFVGECCSLSVRCSRFKVQGRTYSATVGTLNPEPFA